MATGNVSIQALGGGSTYGVIPTSGTGISFLNPLYKYANLTLPYNPNDPGLQYTFYNIGLAPSLFLYARFFNLLNETSQGVQVNVGTSVFIPPGGAGSFSGSLNCLDVRNFGAKGDGTTDDTAAIQKALDQAYLNYLGNVSVTTSTVGVASQIVQQATAHIENGSGSTLSVVMPTTSVAGNTLVLTLATFDYGGGPSNPATPTVTDPTGASWQQAQPPAQNGEFLLWTFYAQASAFLYTVTVNVGGRQYNSYMSAVLAEYTGVLSPFQLDGTAASTGNGSNVTLPSLAASNHPDLVIYGIINNAAAGVIPKPPSDFTYVGGVVNPQPNGLNGALPVLAQAFKNWDGTLAISHDWSNSKGYTTCSSLVAFRRQTITTTTTGMTTVCIPAGVSCLVNPVGLDETQLTKKTCRYGQAAYSLLIQDGVTLEIDGQLIANPNATPSMVGASAGTGWFLVMNKNWIANSTLMTPLIPQPPQLDFLINSVTYNTGVASVNVELAPPVDNCVMFYASIAGTIDGIHQIIIPGNQNPFGDSGSHIIHVDAAEVMAFNRGFASEGQIFNITQTYSYSNPSLDASCAVILMSLKAPANYQSDWFSGPTGGFFPRIASYDGSPFFGTTVVEAATGPGAGKVNPGDILLAVIANTSASALNPFTSVTDVHGNFWVKVSEANNAGLYDPVNNLHYGCSLSIFVCMNPKVVPRAIDSPFGYYYFYAHSSLPLGQDSNNGYVLFDVMNLPGFANCGQPISWTDYVSGVALNEGVRNTGIRLTGAGTVQLNGNSQVSHNGFYPVGLARFVAVDNSVIDYLTIQNPAGCAIQWMDSADDVINAVTISNAAPSLPVNDVSDPGAIEVDLWRSSSITNCVIQTCPINRGILDWAGYQLLVAQNTMNGDYIGYEYRDSAGESAYYFSVGPVTANSQLTANKAINNTTAPSSAGTSGAVGGSNGFLFTGGFVPQANVVSVTGVSFHDNTLDGNSTDFSATSNVEFATQVNNTNSSSSGSEGSGSGGNANPVINGQNIVPEEAPVGTIDGVNTIFTLAHIPISGTLLVYVNGLSEFANVDYTVNGNQILFVTAPNVGSTLIVSYQYLSGN